MVWPPMLVNCYEVVSGVSPRSSSTRLICRTDTLIYKNINKDCLYVFKIQIGITDQILKS